MNERCGSLHLRVKSDFVRLKTNAVASTEPFVVLNSALLQLFAKSPVPRNPAFGAGAELGLPGTESRTVASRDSTPVSALAIVWHGSPSFARGHPARTGAQFAARRGSQCGLSRRASVAVAALGSLAARARRTRVRP